MFVSNWETRHCLKKKTQKEPPEMLKKIRTLYMLLEEKIKEEKKI